MEAHLHQRDNLEWPKFRRRHTRMLADRLSPTATQTINKLDEKRNNLIASESKQQHSASLPPPTPRTFGSRVVVPNRLTLLPEPETDLQSTANEEEALTSSKGVLSSRSFASNHPSHLSRSEMSPKNRSFPQLRVTNDELAYEQDFQNQSSSFGSTTALLILMFCYILWQCFKNQKNRPPMCLGDDWPAGLLTPSKKKKKKGSTGGQAKEQEQCELQTVGRVDALASAVGERSNKSAAILRVRSDNESGQPEVDIIQVEPNADIEKCDVDKISASGAKFMAIRRGLARGSLVVAAANRAAKPRVKLIGAQVRKFVDIEAQDINRAANGLPNETIANRLLRLLRSNGLIGRPNDADETTVHTNELQDIATSEKINNKHEQANMTTAFSKSPPQPDETTAEALLHRNNLGRSRSGSLLGFAGSFLEKTVTNATSPSLNGGCNSIAFNTPQQQTKQEHRFDLRVDQQQQPQSLQQQLSPSPVVAFSSTQLSSTSTSPISKPHYPLLQHSDQNSRHQVGLCCSLARSKSQTSQALCPQQSRNQLLTTSPTNVRPCCSVSPSAMNRHEIDVASQLMCPHQHSNSSQQPQQRAQQLLTQEPGQLFQPMVGQGVYCGNSRAKHHYENYYEDEREDAYRRLTASIGVQFGLALDPHQQAALLPGATTSCSTAVCKCNSSSPRSHMGAGEAAADLSLGESDSGNFSLATTTRQRYKGESICNDSTCSLCQSSLLTTAGPSQQAINMFLPSQPATGIDLPPTNQVQAPLVARWHHKRRSTLYTRQPRRMSITEVASNQMHPSSGPVGPGARQQRHQNFLHHRASIASDGANTFHQHPPSGQHHYYPTVASHHYCSSQAKVASNYSSSAGSSSGLGFSGSQCLNTPTTGAFPFGSFAVNKPFCDFLVGDRLAQTQHNPLAGQTQPAAWHLANTNNFQTPECSAQNVLSPTTGRKFSLPVQLESKAACHLMPPNKSNLLFGPQRDDVSSKPTAALCRPLQTFNVTHGQSFSQPSESLGHKIISSLSIQKSLEQTRRSSQTIIRQSSFWLEDGKPEFAGGSMSVAAIPTTQSSAPANVIAAANSKVLQQMPQAEQIVRVEYLLHPSELTQTDSMPVATASSSSCGPQPESKSSSASPSTPSPPPPLPSAGSRKQLKHHRVSSSTSNSSASLSSPSPDFHRRPRQRLASRTPPAGSITKKRLLGSLKQQRRSHRMSSSNTSTSLQRRQQAAAQLAAPSNLQRQDTANSTDEERKAAKHEDSLSSFDRDVTNAMRERTIPDTNSTSLERQCRDLWKLRATLHDDAHVGDNWSNYHQRLNRRYDSGYKSIENQFSSSIEGPNVMNLSLSGGAAAVAIATENASSEPHPRPQSGCSGMIPEQIEESAPNTQLDPVGSPNPLNEEETQALLENCDDQQDEQ